jgi:hypothetical protein
MFKGPIFLLGRPRSGTKLLRDLLNRHSEISIPSVESNFIPHLYNIFKQFGDVSERKNFDAFYQFVNKTYFIKNVLADSHYSSIDSAKWFDSISDNSYQSVIGSFFILHAQCNNKRIWGDKSPHYMLEIPTLKFLFPDAKFIHIIRDVRDNCLSIQKTWGKTLYFSAQLWADSISKCKTDAKAVLCQTDDYYELKFEKLISHPIDELKCICSFLGIEYEQQMSRLKKASENYGAGKGKTEILSTNMNNWENILSKNQVKKIESIAFDILKSLNYKIYYTNNQKSLTKSERIYLKIMDSIFRFRFDIKDKNGLINAINYKMDVRKYG